MGNSNKRSVSVQSSRKLSLSDPPVLAPVEVVDSDSREAECPICFVSYVALNTVSCCKQSICTGCYHQLKASGDDSSCPFCGRASMHAAYAGGATCGSTPTPTTISAKSSVGQEDSHATRTPQCTSKFSSPASVGSIPTASRSDREALEAEIRNQRQYFVDSDLDRTPSADSRRSEPFFLFSSSSTAGSGQTRSSWTPGVSTPSSRARVQRRRFGRHATDLLGDEPGPPPSNHNNTNEASDRLLSSLQNLLGGTHLDHSGSLEQLEEIMLMEAIRQSMLEVQPLPQPAPAPEMRPASSSSPTRMAPPPPPPLSSHEHSEVDQRRSPEGLLEQINRVLSTPPLSPGRHASPADMSLLWGSSREEGDFLSDSDSSDA